MEQGIKMIFSKTQIILQILFTIKKKTIPKKAEKAKDIFGLEKERKGNS